ncbi:MAG: hypothetical protein QOH54_3862 [Mycobacterium sp.]|jgi:hypothetical protein|nr:hypothetical protein [Mycobacterium sp.]
MTDELRDRIGALAFSVCQTLCWGLDHYVGLDYWDSIEEPPFRHHSAIRQPKPAFSLVQGASRRLA